MVEEARGTVKPGTATAQQADRLSGAEDERLKGSEDRPSPEGAPQSGDFAKVELEKPSGAQAKEASFISSGTVPQGFVPSMNGLVPVSAVPDPENALELQRATGRHPDDKRLTEEVLEEMDSPSVRAVGVQRGYEMPAAGGGRTMRRVFLAEQEKDSRFKEQEKDPPKGKK